MCWSDLQAGKKKTLYETATAPDGPPRMIASHTWRIRQDGTEGFRKFLMLTGVVRKLPRLLLGV